MFKKKILSLSAEGMEILPEELFQSNVLKQKVSVCPATTFGGFVDFTLAYSERVGVQSDRFSISGKKIYIGDFVNQPLTHMEKIVFL